MGRHSAAGPQEKRFAAFVDGLAKAAGHADRHAPLKNCLQGMGEAVPATAFLDQEGDIVARISGQIKDGEIRERLDWLLSDQSTSPPPAFVNHLDK